MIEQLIDWIDRQDGDSDFEAEGTEDSFDDHEALFGYTGPGCEIADAGGGDIVDERHDGDGDDADGTNAEDEIASSVFFRGPGCPISDPGGGNVEDEGEQVNEDGIEVYFCG
jgi:hypothetical protein